MLFSSKGPLSKPTIALLATLALGISVSEATKYSVCDSTKTLAEVKDVRISDCDTKTEVCPFVRGFNKSIELDFVPKQNIEQVKVRVAGKLNNLPVPFLVKPDNACGNYGFNCPLEANKPYTFQLSLPILRSYPKLSVDVFLRLVDEQGEIISCVEMPARIQEPLKAD